MFEFEEKQCRKGGGYLLCYSVILLSNLKVSSQFICMNDNQLEMKYTTMHRFLFSLFERERETTEDDYDFAT